MENKKHGLERRKRKRIKPALFLINIEKRGINVK